MQNRIIKFRAYSKATNKMMDWEFIQSVRNFNKLLTLDFVEVMQFTGLLDKNGVEIYEGDIMSTGHGWSNYTVVFEDGSFCFGNDQPNGADRLSHDRVGRLEVIGNIYETPTP